MKMKNHGPDEGKMVSVNLPAAVRSSRPPSNIMNAASRMSAMLPKPLPPMRSISSPSPSPSRRIFISPDSSRTKMSITGRAISGAIQLPLPAMLAVTFGTRCDAGASAAV